MNNQTLQSGSFYHIYNHANGFELLFRERTNYLYFLQKWKKYINPFADTIAYCLMPNHFHFIIHMKDLQGVEDLGGLTFNPSQQFSNLFNCYTKAYNKMYYRMGSLFKQNFQRKIVCNEYYLKYLVAYIHLNPVKHKYCNDKTEWEFSSIHEFHSEKVEWVNSSISNKLFFDQQDLSLWHQFVNLAMTKKLKSA